MKLHETRCRLSARMESVKSAVCGDRIQLFSAPQCYSLKMFTEITCTSIKRIQFFQYLFSFNSIFSSFKTINKGKKKLTKQWHTLYILLRNIIIPVNWAGFENFLFWNVNYIKITNFFLYFCSIFLQHGNYTKSVCSRWVNHLQEMLWSWSKIKLLSNRLYM